MTPETLEQTILRIMRKIRNPFYAGSMKSDVFYDISQVEFDDWQYYYIAQAPGQRIIHKRGDSLNDFPFGGNVYAIAPLTDFIELCQRINSWLASPAAQTGNKTSEQVFGSYAVSYATNKDGKPLDWHDVFSNELSAFRQMFWPEEVIY